MFIHFMRCGLFAVAAMLIGAAATPGFAKVITFDDLDFCSPSIEPCSYTEKGFIFEALDLGDFGPFFRPGTMHFDNAFGPYMGSVRMTSATGGLFALSAMDLLPISELVDFPPTEPYAKVSGFRNGTLVSFVQLGNPGSGSTVTFGSGFSFLDEVVIATLVTPTISDLIDRVDDVHFDIDNIVASKVAPVPLPAGAPLLLAALAALFGLCHRAGTRGAA